MNVKKRDHTISTVPPIQLATHEGAQAASQHCPVPSLVGKVKISNSEQNCHGNIKQPEVLPTQKSEEV